MQKSAGFLSIIALCFFLNSCSAIEGIFKAGFWSGILLVAVIVIAAIFILTKIFKKK